jgi:hypothetical protein
LQKLTVDEAVAEFYKVLEAELGPATAAPWRAGAAETPAEAEARHFRLAEELLRHACPDPARCGDPSCRRRGLCRHFADLRARQQGRRGQPATRRTPGAAALRHAIWVLMNSNGGA